MYIYILPVHHYSILAKSFLRRLKNNNIFKLQLSNPDSGLPSGWKYYESYDDRENSSNYKNYYNYMRDIALYLGADRRSKEKLLQHSFFFQLQLHRVSNVSITSRNLWIKYDTVTTLITSW